MFACPSWFKIPLRSTSVVAEQVPLASSDLLRRCAVILHRRFESFRRRYYKKQVIIMGKVYLKTKYDNEMKMEIPHNHNFASAMFGFREMAAEIVPYHLIDDIYDDFKREDIALDYIDQCNVLFNKFGVTPHIPDYPDVLKPFLGRKIWKDTINSISRDECKWSAGYFVKPIRSKAFTGKTISSIKDLMGCGNHAEDYEVLVSEALDIAAEWRCFITYDEIMDVRPYGMIIDKSRKGYLYHYGPMSRFSTN